MLVRPEQMMVSDQLFIASMFNPCFVNAIPAAIFSIFIYINFHDLSKNAPLNMNKSLTVIVSFVFLFVSLVSFGQKKFILVDKELNALEKERLFNGSVLVAKSGKVIYKRNIGYADIEHKIPIDRNTKFEIASITNTFTAILVLQLVEK